MWTHLDFLPHDRGSMLRLRQQLSPQSLEQSIFPSAVVFFGVLVSKQSQTYGRIMDRAGPRVAVAVCIFAERQGGDRTIGAQNGSSPPHLGPARLPVSSRPEYLSQSGLGTPDSIQHWNLVSDSTARKGCGTSLCHPYVALGLSASSVVHY